MAFKFKYLYFLFRIFNLSFCERSWSEVPATAVRPFVSGNLFRRGFMYLKPLLFDARIFMIVTSS